MIANYHTHTWRCKHASGTEREYVESAIRGGLKILGFSDHTPMPYDGDYVSPVKMTMDQLEDYVNTILQLKEEYKNDIEIHVGLEVEYYPAYFNRLVDFARQFPIEYFILGQHCLGNEIGDKFMFEPIEDPKDLHRYCDQVVEGLKTGRFTYLCHPDVIPFVGDRGIYRDAMRGLCREVKKLDIPMEINFLGIWDHRNYPDPDFWKIAGEEGNTVIFGADAHRPDKVWVPEALEKAQRLASDNGLRVLETIEFTDPFKI